ncbi:NAD(P)H-binding protein [Phytomonospora sp. NPDC050363]|uniref:NAD(P)H-binding protein n=1 Tax=Phytomonospora sp. NPDC050363 TaxID=3155642 RepID=UPI0033EF7199
MITVTGATGNVGRLITRQLADAGETVTAVSRTAAHLPEGVTHRAADLGEPATLAAAFAGGETLFLLVAGEDPHAILDAAKAAGVRRLVLLSSQGAGTRPDAFGHPRAFEDAVRASGFDWTILRPSGFASNSFAWAASIRTARAAAAPFADIALPFIDPADIAAVAATVLRESGHSGRTYVLTGPAATTPRERAALIAEAIGEPIAFTELTRDEAAARMLAFMPRQAVTATLGILGEPTPAEQAVSPDAEAVLGRAPGTFAVWAAHHALAFR